MSAWLRPVREERSARLQLFCFPHAGAGAAAFHRWGKQLPPQIAVWAVEPPGRGTRLRESPRRRMVDLAEPLASALEPHLDRPFVLYGHSLGGLVAFEVARILAHRGAPTPARLVVGAVRSPERAHLSPVLHNLPAPLFIRELRRMHGTAEVILLDPELLELVMPALRADFEIFETYRFSGGVPLNCPITVYHGIRDHLVGDADVAGWEVCSRQAFGLERIAANHFFLEDPLFLERFCSELRDISTRCAASSQRAPATEGRGDS